jgi:hypothetical protein
MTRPRVSDVRKAITLGVKLAVALRQLGFAKGERVDFDHDPALALRPWDDEKQDFIPPQLDPDFIVIAPRPLTTRRRTATALRATAATSTPSRRSIASAKPRKPSGVGC